MKYAEAFIVKYLAKKNLKENSLDKNFNFITESSNLYENDNSMKSESYSTRDSEKAKFYIQNNNKSKRKIYDENKNNLKFIQRKVKKIPDLKQLKNINNKWQKMKKFNIRKIYNSNNVKKLSDCCPLNKKKKNIETFKDCKLQTHLDKEELNTLLGNKYEQNKGNSSRNNSFDRNNLALEYFDKFNKHESKSFIESSCRKNFRNDNLNENSNEYENIYNNKTNQLNINMNYISFDDFDNFNSNSNFFSNKTFVNSKINNFNVDDNFSGVNQNVVFDQDFDELFNFN